MHTGTLIPEHMCALWHVRASWERDQGVTLNTDALSTSSLSQGREEGPEICLKLRALDANASGNGLVPREEAVVFINTGNFSLLFCAPEMQKEEFARY